MPSCVHSRKAPRHRTHRRRGWLFEASTREVNVQTDYTAGIAFDGVRLCLESEGDAEGLRARHPATSHWT